MIVASKHSLIGASAPAGLSLLHCNLCALTESYTALFRVCELGLVLV